MIITQLSAEILTSQKYYYTTVVSRIIYSTSIYPIDIFEENSSLPDKQSTSIKLQNYLNNYDCLSNADDSDTNSDLALPEEIIESPFIPREVADAYQSTARSEEYTQV